MKKKITICILTGTLLAFTPFQAHALRCELWDLLNAVVTPLPVTDNSSNKALNITYLQQSIEAIEAGIQNITKKLKLDKWSLAGSDLSRDLTQIQVPKIEDLEKGGQSAVDAFKGQSAGKTMSSGEADFKNEETVSKTVEEVAVVSNPVDSADRQSEIERKQAFIQQAVLDLNARVLYYKKELQDLKNTDSSAQSSSGSEDTVGSHDVSMQMKDADARVQALQEKITAARLELLAIQNLKKAETVQDEIEVKGDS